MIDQPSDKEEEYFKLRELEKIKRHREEAARETAAKERERLKQQHWMRCPKCGMELAEVDFRSVKVDACFACGGMFLDQGEIEKILEQESGEDGAGVISRIVSGLFGTKTD